MVVGIKDTFKLIGISIAACCAVFVCTLFLNYNIDLEAIKDEIVTEAGMAMYHAQVSMGKVTAAVTGGCMAVTSVIMLLFYIKNYIDAHGRELGILKALGYADVKIAKHFWIFGVSILAGCGLGTAFAFLYMPTLYRLQNAEGLFPEIPVSFHFSLTFLLVCVPAALFAAISVFYAYIKLKNPVLNLLREKQEYKGKPVQKEAKKLPFLKDLKRITLKGRKALVFFVAFSAFCFSSTVQMSMSMKELASESFAFMIITIGLLLSFITLLLSLSSVVRGNMKAIAMMRVFGYGHTACRRAILGGYRPFAFLGFFIGTIYQYVLLKTVVTVVFADIGNVPEYHFNMKTFGIAFVIFIVAYELMTYCCSLRIKKASVKSIMLQ